MRVQKPSFLEIPALADFPKFCHQPHGVQHPSSRCALVGDVPFYVTGTSYAHSHATHSPPGSGRSSRDPASKPARLL